MGLTGRLTSPDTLRASAPTQAQIEAEQAAHMAQAEAATLYIVKQSAEMKDDEQLLWLWETLMALGLDQLNRAHRRADRQKERDKRMVMRVKARAKLSLEMKETLGQPILGYAKA